MRYTPVELRHVRPGRALFGFKRDETEKLLEDAVESFEEVWRERGELADRVEDIEKVLAEVKQREALLTSALVSAEKAAVEAKEAARREAELIVAEAHQEARSVTRAAQSERERLFGEVRRVETLLRAALGMVEETRNELPAADRLPEHWPRREDTREFEAIEAPAPNAEAEAGDEPAELPPVQSLVQPDEHEGNRTARDFAWG